jgi:phage-related protein
MNTPKPVEWIASSRDDLREFPKEVRRVMGQAIDDAEHGDEHPSAKRLRGSVAGASLKSSMTLTATLTAPSTPSNSLV